MPDVTRELESLRSRFVWQAFVGHFVACSLVASIALLLLVCGRYFAGIVPWTTTGFLILLGLAAASAAALAIARRLSLAETASRIDALGGTRDRFLTRYRLSGKSTRSALEDLALAECESFVAKFDPAPFVRPKRATQAFWCAAPIVAALLVTWHFQIAHRPTAKSLATQAELEEKADELEQLRQQVKKAAEELRSEELERLAEEMKRSVESLRNERDRGDRAEAKTALRELSALEAMVQAMQEQSERQDEELDALEKALEANEETKDAAEALKDRDLAKAAEELEKALEELEKKGGEEADEEMAKLAQAMQEALDELSDAQRERIAEQMKKLAQSQGQASKEAMKRLAEMMKQMAKNPQRAQSPEQAKQAMKNMLQALQNMKFDDGKGNRTALGQPQPGKGQDPGTMTLSFAPPGGDLPGLPMPGMPTGEPGSERDEGTTDSPFGAVKNNEDAGSTEVQLSGTMGEGESLSEMMLSTGDKSRSTQRYRELYDAIAGDAESAVAQEDIPLGSRFYIRRYFESIRPQE